MSKLYRMQFFESKSDKRKSKTCTEVRRNIHNLKWGWILAIVVAFAMCGAVAEAQQQAKVSKIGWLSAGPAGPGSTLESFQQEFGKLGYVEGKNIAIESRYADNKLERLPALADELVRLKVTYSSRPGRLKP